MKRILALLYAALLYGSLATVLTQTAFLGVAWWKGQLRRERLWDVMAVLYGVDYQEIRHRLDLKDAAITQEQPSPASRRNEYLRESLDLNLRETALEKGILDLQLLQASLETTQDRFKKLKESYDQRLREIAQGN